MINAHINALNRAYALIDNKIDGLTSREDMTAFLNDLEAQSCEPMMDLLYIHAAQVINEKLSTKNEAN